MSLVCVSQHKISTQHLFTLKDKIKSFFALPVVEHFHQNFESQSLTLTFDHPLSWRSRSLPELFPELHAYLQNEKIDYFFSNNNFQTPIKIALFDMDSTLIEQEVVDEMAKFHGVGDQVKEITKKAMNNEMNFDQSLRQRLALLKGFQQKHLLEILSSLTINPGVPQTINHLRSKNIKTAVVSGGFYYFAENIKKTLNLDYCFANNLEFSDGVLTGNIQGDILNAQRKKEILQYLVKEEQVNIQQSLAVGDGANDIPMLQEAGIGITFHAKEKVNQIIPHHIQHGCMTTLLFYIGVA